MLNSNKLYLNMKPINPIQKYPHTIEYMLVLYICLKTFIFNEFSNFFGICSTPNLSK